MKTEISAGAIRSQLNDKFQAMQERIGEAARNVSETTDEYVRDNPWRIIGYVAAAALILGFFLGNRRS